MTQFASDGWDLTGRLETLIVTHIISHRPITLRADDRTPAQRAASVKETGPMFMFSSIRSALRWYADKPAPAVEQIWCGLQFYSALQPAAQTEQQG
jgi:hypothetical protein